MDHRVTKVLRVLQELRDRQELKEDKVHQDLLESLGKRVKL